MKNKEFQKLLKKNKSKSNSGFTLTELLVGMIMSIFVVGALGFGLMQMLSTTQKETTRVNSRTESSRAFNFIADEMKAAQTVEVDMSPTNIAAVATDFDGDGTVRLALNVPGVTQRVIYSVGEATDNWNGPLVIYRWGPNINANGKYSDPLDTSDWQNEALIDGVSDVDQDVTCDADGDGTAETFTYKGFYACVVDDDEDPIVENAVDTDGDGDIDKDDTADLNGDGVADAKDGADTDGTSITAQLYFAADTANGVYTTDSQVVARARVAPLRKPELREPEPVYFESLNPQYGRFINNDPNRPCWTVRNDFGTGKNPSFDPDLSSPHPDALSDILTWVHEDNRQPQPLNIDTTKPFTMVASAFAKADPNGQDFYQCLAKGNKYKQKLVSINDDGSNAIYSNVDENGNDVDDANKVAANGEEKIHTYENKVWHTIEFPESGDTDAEIAAKQATYNGNATDNYDVKGDGTVYMFRNDSTVPDVGGYDANDNGVLDSGDQPSLRQILQDKGLADSNGNIIESKLQANQRIVVFEIGQTEPGTNENPNPGFDLQDSMFIMTSDAFLPRHDDSN